MLSLFRRKPSVPASVPVVPPLSLGELQAMQADIRGGQERLGSLVVFQTDDPALAQAWEAKAVERIASLLKAGEASTRGSWETATKIMNAAAGQIDKARGSLSRQVRAVEIALAAYQIDMGKIHIDRSKLLSVDAKRVITRRSVPRQIDVGRGIGSIGGRAIGGSVPWQVALASIAVGLVAHQIQTRRALRKLKELEGEVLTQAQTATGDIALFQNLMTTRVVPQFETLLALSETMERQLAELAEEDPEQTQLERPPSVAFALATAMLEAKHVLGMTAGD